MNEHQDQGQVISNPEPRTGETDTRKFKSLSLKILTGVLAISALFTLMVTSLQLFADYNQLVGDTKKQIKLIEKSYLSGFAESIWSFNEDQIDEQYAGMLAVPGVSYLEYRDSSSGRVTAKGVKPKTSITDTFEIKYKGPTGDMTLGTLTVSADKEALSRAIQSKAIMILGLQFVKTSAVSILIIWFIRNLLTSPIVRIGQFLSRFDPNIRPERLNINRGKIHSRSRDEIDTLINITDNMSTNLYFKSLEVKKHQYHLEELVDLKTRNLRLVFSSIKQGIMTIDEDHTIHPEYSDFLETILESSSIEGETIDQILLKDSSLAEEEKSMIQSTLISAIGEGELAWSMNAHLLPTDISYSVNDKIKYIEIDWAPLLKDATVERVMVALRDVTEIRKLKEASEAKREKTELIEQVISLNAEKFYDFIQNCNHLIGQSLESMEQSNISVDSYELLLANLHTLKGLSRTYGFKRLSSEVHEVEDKLFVLKEDIERLSDEQKNSVFDETRSILKIIATYEEVNTQIENRSKKIDPDTLTAEVNDVMTRENIGEPIILEVINKIRGAVASGSHSETRPLSQTLGELISGNTEVAKSLGKELPVFHYVGEEYTIGFEGRSFLNSIVPHLVRNSLDHGIELPEHRVEKGKDAKGHIYFGIESGQVETRITYRDDGGGIKLGYLRKKVSKDASDLEVANVIFESSVSTAEKVTDVSGRGVGMDAVKRTIELAGGAIRIEFISGTEGDDSRNFQLVITIPTESLIAKPSEKENMITAA